MTLEPQVLELIRTRSAEGDAIEEAILQEAILVDSEVGAHQGCDLLVTRIEYANHAELAVPTAIREQAVGRILSVDPAFTSGLGWLWRDPSGAFGVFRVFGAPLNPTPINGHHYRAVDPTTTARRLMRYNDEEHMDARLVSHCPWSILENMPGSALPYADGYHAEELAFAYIEVRFGPTPVDMAAALLAPFGEDATPDTTPVGIPTTISTDTDFLHGMCEPVGGLVPLNPSLTTGRMYLLWTDETSNTRNQPRLAIATATGDFAVSGFIDRWGEFQRDMDGRLRHTTENGLRWALVRDYIPTRVDAPVGERTVRMQLHDMKVQYREWQVALNELAEEMDWCGEYESAVRRLDIMPEGTDRYAEPAPVPEVDDQGFEQEAEEPEPPKVKRLWMFDVSYSATFEIDSPSDSIDSRVSDDIGLDMQTSSMRFEATGTVRVGPVAIESDAEDDGEDEAKDQIDDDVVEEAIKSIMSTGDLDSLGNWSIDGSGDEVTNEYDVEDYF